MWCWVCRLHLSCLAQLWIHQLQEYLPCTGPETTRGWHLCDKCGKQRHVHSVATPSVLQEPLRSATFCCNLNADIWYGVHESRCFQHRIEQWYTPSFSRHNCCEDALQATTQHTGIVDGMQPFQLPQPFGKDEAVLGSGSHVLGSHCIDSHEGVCWRMCKTFSYLCRILCYIIAGYRV